MHVEGISARRIVAAWRPCNEADVIFRPPDIRVPRIVKEPAVFRFVRYLPILLILVLTAGPATAQNQQPQTQSSNAAQDQASAPTITTVLRSASELVADLEYLIRLAGPEGAKQWEQYIQPTLETFLQGIDVQRPVRIDVLLGGETTRYRPAFPVANRRQFEQNLEAFGIEIRPQGQLYALTGTFEGFMRYAHNYAIIAEQRADLPANIPNPQQAVQPLIAKGYDLAGNIQNPPQGIEQRRQAIEQIRDELMAALKPMPEEIPEEFELRRLLLEQQIDELQRFFAESAQLVLGWTTNAQQNQGRLDLQLSALPQTDLQNVIAQLGQAPSIFGGVPMQQNSILFLRVHHPLGEMRKTHLLELSQKLRSLLEARINASERLSEELRPPARQMVQQLFDLWDATAQAGYLDGFINVWNRPSGGRTLVGAIKVTDGSAFVPILENFPNVDPRRQVQLNVDQQGDVKIHSVSVPKEDSPQLLKFFGADPTMDGVVHIGTGPQAIWYAGGQGSLEALKQAISQAQGGESPVVAQLHLVVGPWLELLDQIRGDQGTNVALRRRAIEAFQKSPGVISGNLRRVENRVEGQVQFGKGILQFVGEVLAQFSKENLQ